MYRLKGLYQAIIGNESNICIFLLCSILVLGIERESSNNVADFSGLLCYFSR